jgi:hypothetical protein
MPIAPSKISSADMLLVGSVREEKNEGVKKIWQ